MAAVLERDVADGVHRRGGQRLPDRGRQRCHRRRHRPAGHLETALERLGRQTGDVRAVVLTHAHFDHVGSAKRARGRWQVPVFVHAADQYPAGALFVLPGHGEPWHHGIASAAEAALRAGPS